MSNEAIVREHVESMEVPESTGRHILDAIAVVEGYLKNQAEVAQINTDVAAINNFNNQATQAMAQFDTLTSK